jgi:SAM-dependent methyltransferase
MRPVRECASERDAPAAILERMRRDGELAMPVCDPDGKLAGVVYPEAEFIRHVQPVESSASLEEALTALATQNVGWLPVVADGRPVGLAGLGEISAHLEIDEQLGPLVLEVSHEVSPNDEMFAFDGTWTSYLSVAASALSCIRRGMKLAGKEHVRGIFDLACGHGRVLRVLRVAFPGARITACDINADGVEFCARTFGADPMLSHEDAQLVEVRGPFDLVWCGSLFSHFDAPRWDSFLGLIESVIEPGGVLVMTIHGRRIADALRSGAPDPKLSKLEIVHMLRGYDRGGFGYADYPGEPGWGDSIATPDWVRDAIEQRPSLRLLGYEESGWAQALDVVICDRPAV